HVDVVVDRFDHDAGRVDDALVQVVAPLGVHLGPQPVAATRTAGQVSVEQHPLVQPRHDDRALGVAVNGRQGFDLAAVVVGAPRRAVRPRGRVHQAAEEAGNGLGSPAGVGLGYADGEGGVDGLGALGDLGRVDGYCA